MLTSLFRFVRSVDLLLLLSVGILFVFGCAALYSIGLGKEPQNFVFVQKQLTVFAIFSVLLFFVGAINYRLFRSASFAIYAVVACVLVAVLVFGVTIRGTKGWFSFAGFSIQPAELAKIALIFVLARYISTHARTIKHVRHLFVTALFAGIPIGLILLQPDFGSAVVLFCIWAGMIAISGISRRSAIGLAILLCVLAASAWLFVFKDYQKQRILTFIAPQSTDQRGSGYNVRQALIAIGSGQLFGRGLGLGSQSHLKFLPETQTDFIFSVLAEETGLFGVLILFLFWLVFFYRLIVTMRRSSDDFALYTVLGITILFATHVLLNIGGNLGLVPLTGLVLPFMSYGGSSLAVSLIAVGIVQSIRSHSV